MSEPIKVGDLVIVVRAKQCCGYAGTLDHRMNAYDINAYFGKDQQ